MTSIYLLDKYKTRLNEVEMSQQSDVGEEWTGRQTDGNKERKKKEGKKEFFMKNHY